VALASESRAVVAASYRRPRWTTTQSSQRRTQNGPGSASPSPASATRGARGRVRAARGDCDHPCSLRPAARLTERRRTRSISPWIPAARITSIADDRLRWRASNELPSQIWGDNSATGVSCGAPVESRRQEPNTRSQLGKFIESDEIATVRIDNASSALCVDGDERR
jgi:hypothetical protein